MPGRLTEGGANRVVNGLVPPMYDIVDITYPTTTVEVYTFKLKNMATGVEDVMGVIELTYTDADKSDLSRVERIA